MSIIITTLSVVILLIGLTETAGGRVVGKCYVKKAIYVRDNPPTPCRCGAMSEKLPSEHWKCSLVDAFWLVHNSDIYDTFQLPAIEEFAKNRTKKFILSTEVVHQTSVGAAQVCAPTAVTVVKTTGCQSLRTLLKTWSTSQNNRLPSIQANKKSARRANKENIYYLSIYITIIH